MGTVFEHSLIASVDPHIVVCARVVGLEDGDPVLSSAGEHERHAHPVPGGEHLGQQAGQQLRVKQVVGGLHHLRVGEGEGEGEGGVG